MNYFALGIIRGIVLAADLSFLASAADDRSLAIWSFKKREELKSFESEV